MTLEARDLDPSAAGAGTDSVSYRDAYSDPAITHALSRRLHATAQGRPGRVIMEVCGTHTMSIFRHGVRALLPSNLRLISGPGCPVCVTPPVYLDQAIALARRADVTITTFGDLVRVPGSASSLEREKADRADVRIVYSPLDAVDLAERFRAEGTERTVVFLGVGFETTTPGAAQAILEARRRGISNFRVLGCHRRVVPALEALLRNPALRLDGFLLPGHVSVVLGSDAYRFLAGRGVSGVVAGFEPVDILRALVRLLELIEGGHPGVENQYPRLVSASGNLRALAAMDEVFEPVDAPWRGLGVLPESGLRLRRDFADFDALRLLDDAQLRAIEENAADESGCLCGEVLTGLVSPLECPFFGEACTPESPIGPCMVSSEGTCAAYYKYQAR